MFKTMGAANSAPDRPSSSTPHRSSIAARFNHTNENEITYRDKKKKASKFATLRKKLIRVRRQSRGMDYSKVVRDLTSSWDIHELSALVDDYEALSVLKELTLCANLARPPINTLRSDLARLFDQSYCSDVNLVYQSTCIPSHRAILCIRCPYFRELLSRYPYHGAQVPVKVRTSGVDVTTFTALIRYLYTDELNTAGTHLDNVKVLNKLIDEFGLPNQLEHDMKTLLDLGLYSDAVLVFSSDCDFATNACDQPSGMKHELRCHKAILAARSVFFRNLLQRRALYSRCGSDPYKILLDERVIAKPYARVLLQTIYTDVVDLSCIVRSSVSMCSLSEVQAIVAGKVHVTRVDEAIEVYQIGQFLDLPILSQGCEDIIVENVNTDNLLSILDWSQEPHGSHWVHRQAMHYLREEFIQISHTPLLYDLNKHYLIETVKSNFLQGTELDILSAVLKWGEYKLMRIVEEREPNILTHTAHSVAKKGIKKRDLNDTELREILADVLPYICIEHVLPTASDVVLSMMRRSLISTPPTHILGADLPTNLAHAWVRGLKHGAFVQPRFFFPYYEEFKAILEERQLDDNSDPAVRMVRMSSIPDTLYMVDEHEYSRQDFSPFSPTAVSTVDIIAGTIPVPDAQTLEAMRQCEQTIQQSVLARRAYSLSHTDKRAVTFQIHLRVVREFGLPDSAVEVLQKKTHHQYDDAAHFDERHFKPIHSPQKGLPRARSAPISPVLKSCNKKGATSSTSDAVHKEMVPDIAIGTASLDQQLCLNQLDIQDSSSELTLDLGDGGEGGRQRMLYL